MSNILVTGGCGFIGSHVCEALLERGDSVVCIDNFNDYYDPLKKEENAKILSTNPRFKLYRGDTRDKELLRKIFELEDNNLEKIIHLAARAGVRRSFEEPDLYFDTNINSTKNLLNFSADNKLPFVFASSSSIYGVNTKVPFSEEDEVTNQVSPYATTKKHGEEICLWYSVQKGMDITCLRFFTVYGPRGRPDMAPYKFVDAIANNRQIEIYIDEQAFEMGEMARDYTYVKDIVSGILSSADRNSGNPFEIINLGRGQPIRLNEFVSTIEDLLGKKAIKKFIGAQKGDVPITYADISKARNLLGYNPQTSLKQGLKALVDWYQKRD